MNLTEKLLKNDQKKFTELHTKQYKSKVLSDILDEEVFITLKIPDNVKLLDLSKKVNTDEAEKQMDAIKLICAESIIDPDLKSKELKAMFSLDEKSTPIQLMEKLWGDRQLELISIANEILKISGINVDSKEIQD